MPPGAFVGIVCAILLLAVAGFFFSGLYRLKENESLILIRSGEAREVKGKGWHYALPILNWPWKRISEGREEMTYVDHKGQETKIKCRIKDADLYYKGRHEIHGCLEEALKKKEKERILKESLLPLGLELEEMNVTPR